MQNMSFPITTPSIRRGILAGAFLALANASHAAIVLSFQQVGADVVETGSGSANLTALTFATGAAVGAQVSPSISLATVGPASLTGDSAYIGLSGPSNFGAGGGANASSGSGSIFGLVGAAGRLLVPAGYVSGTALSGTSTFSGATFASLGITPGTFTYGWGTGATADSLTVQVGPAAAAVPEPGSALAGLLALGVCFSGLVKRNRRQTAQA